MTTAATAQGRPLERRHAIVTGGARGIGLAIARRYLAAGASVALWDVEAAALAEAVQQLAATAQCSACACADGAVCRS